MNNNAQILEAITALSKKIDVLLSSSGSAQKADALPQNWQTIVDNWLTAHPAPIVFKMDALLIGALNEQKGSHPLKVKIGDYLRSKGFSVGQTLHEGERGLFWREGLPLGWQDKLTAYFKAAQKTYFTTNEIFIKGLQLDRSKITQGFKRALSAHMKAIGFDDRYTLAGNGQLGRYWLSPDHIPITSTTDYYPEKNWDDYDQPAPIKTTSKPQPANSNIIIDTDWGDDDEDLDDLV